ncbi:MAG: FHA domain-containing protein [Myxococcota bacterium]
MTGYELVLPDGVSVPIGDHPIGIGRGPMNGVVLTDDSVSWQHAQAWIEGGAAWVRDLGSRNGTFVNGQRAAGSVRLSDGDQVRIGVHVVLRLSGGGGPAWRARHLEDVATGARVMFRGDRFVLGSAPGSDLRVASWPPRAATVVLHANGEVWVGTEADEVPIDPARPFEVHGRWLRLVDALMDHAPTVDLSPTGYPYVLTVNGNGAGGPTAVLRDPIDRRELALTGNRGVLLFALARQWARDADRPAAERGWCLTEDVLTALWGRGSKDANPLNVLVHRLRAHLTEEGFDPWFLEKRRGAIRLALSEVVLT